MNTHKSHRFVADGDDNQECEYCQTRPYSQLAQTVCPDSPTTQAERDVMSNPHNIAALDRALEDIDAGRIVDTLNRGTGVPTVYLTEKARELTLAHDRLLLQGAEHVDQILTLREIERLATAIRAEASKWLNAELRTPRDEDEAFDDWRDSIYEQGGTP